MANMVDAEDYLIKQPRNAPFDRFKHAASRAGVVATNPEGEWPPLGAFWISVELSNCFTGTEWTTVFGTEPTAKEKTAMLENSRWEAINAIGQPMEQPVPPRVIPKEGVLSKLLSFGDDTRFSSRNDHSLLDFIW
jgi:hypothetical protein